MYVRKGSACNALALVQVTVWCRIGNSQLPEPMITLFTDTSENFDELEITDL